MTRLWMARDHGLRLGSVADAMDLIASGHRRCIFAPGDLSADFLDLKTRLAGEVFQKLINYRCEIAIVLPPDHGFGPRVTELAKEYASHPVIRFFSTESAAMTWAVAID